MDCLNAAGRLTAADYRKAVIYTTHDPVAVRYVHRSDIALWDSNGRDWREPAFRGPEELLAGRGVELHLVDDTECYRIMQEFIREHPALWNEDIGERQ